MHVFRNVLVSVDLTRGHDFHPSASGNPGKEAVHTAFWLARKSSAHLTFFSVLPGDGSVPAGPAREILSNLAGQAEASGLQAQIEVVEGTPWEAIIRQVENGKHDIVLVGAPAARGLAYALFGSTTTKLVHKCPCPVWIAEPSQHPVPQNVLIASDLTPGSARALRIGTCMARDLGLRAHVLHVVDYPLEYHWSTGEPDPLTTEYHRQVRSDAIKELRKELQRTGCLCSALDVQIHVLGWTGIPDFDILHFIKLHQIDLLVAGATNRGGIGERLLGNTVERMLPEVPCPVVVVQPGGLRCPLLEV